MKYLCMKVVLMILSAALMFRPALSLTAFILVLVMGRVFAPSSSEMFSVNSNVHLFDRIFDISFGLIWFLIYAVALYFFIWNLTLNNNPRVVEVVGCFIVIFLYRIIFLAKLHVSFWPSLGVQFQMVNLCFINPGVHDVFFVVYRGTRWWC